MKRRPILAVLAAFLFLFFPFEWAYELRAQRLSLTQGIQVDFSGFLFSGILPLLLMAGLIRVSRLGWYSLFCFVACWGVRDAHLLARYEGRGAWAVVGHLALFAVSLFYFVHPRVRTLYFDPKQRWWKTKPRYATHLPALCFDGVDWHYPLLANISSGGCFLETPTPAPVESHVTVAIPLPEPLGVAVLRAKGQVRWISGGEKRSGYGVQFVDLDQKHHQALIRLVQQNS